MALKIVDHFEFGGVHGVEYLCEDVGDGLPMHNHTFNHITKVTGGKVEIRTDKGICIEAGAGATYEYSPGTYHCITALVPGATFLNISKLGDN